MQTFKDLYPINGWCSKPIRLTVLSKRQSIQFLWNLLPVLLCQFFKINYLHASKLKKVRVQRSGIDTNKYYTFFRKVDLILIVKSDIIIIAMNTDKKISFLFKIY